MRIKIRENKYSVAVTDFVAFSRLLRFLYPHYYQTGVEDFYGGEDAGQVCN